MACGGHCSCGGAGCRTDAQATAPGLAAAPGLVDPGLECGSGENPPARVLLRPRRRQPSAPPRLQHAALLPGLGEAPLRRLVGGRIVVDGPELDRRSLALRAASPAREARRRDRLGGLLFPGAPRDGRSRGEVLRPARPCDEGCGHRTRRHRVAAAAAPASAAPPVVGGASAGRDVWFGYRATEFTVPSAWLVAYRSDLVAQHAAGTGAAVGSVSGIDEALSFLWGDVQILVRAAGVDPRSFDGLLSCYNLPTDTMPTEMGASFWHRGWGPPLEFHRWTLALITVFSRQVEEPCTGDWHCDGFGDWLASVLRDERTERDLEGEGPCKVKFRYMNFDTTHAMTADTGEGSESWTCGALAGRSTACDEGFQVEHRDGVLRRYDRGADWDTGLPPARFDTTANAWLANGRAAHPVTSISTPIMSGELSAYVEDATWAVTQRPEFLAWFGFVTDYILYLARMAFDYARDLDGGARPSERAEYRQKAYELGRYALRLLTDRGRLVIHELGHVHNGLGGHCTRGECCFDLAAYRWECAVTAQLGLPIDPGTSAASDTWSNTGRAINRSYCQPEDSKVTTDPRVYCGVHTPGDTGTRWVFWCTTCSGVVGTDVEGLS